MVSNLEMIGRWLALCSCVLFGCSPFVEGSDSSADATTGDTEAGSGSTDPIPTETTTTTTTTSPGTDPTVTATTNSSMGETDGPSCAPGPVSGSLACQLRGSTRAGFEFESDSAFERGPVSCTVQAITDDGEFQDVRLACDGIADALTLGIRTVDPHQGVLLSAEETVLVEYRETLDLRVPDRYITIRDAQGTLRFAAIDGVEVPGPDIIDLAPLALEVVTSECDGKEAGEFCVVVQRAGLQVDYDDSSVVVFDGNHASVGALTSYAISAEMVEREVCWPDECGVNYFTWGVHALFFLIPEG